MKLARFFHSSSCLKHISLKVPLPSKELVLPKFNFPKNTHTISKINESIEFGEEVILSGWINQKPKKIGKNLLFAEFRDYNGGLTQLISKDVEIIEKFKNLQIEDCIVVKGKVEQKVNKSNDNSIKWDLNIKEFQLLNNSGILSSQLNDLKMNNFKEFPPNYRYLQLRHCYYQNTIKTRSRTSQFVRNYLHNHDFTEIETPILFKSTPEGAREFIVPTRQPNLFYALPQSPQQYKQLLMASGFKNYFQIARCFRDEDLRKDRQPEFTQIDIEMSFVDRVEVQNTVEGLVKDIWSKNNKESIKTIDLNHDLKNENSDFIHLDYDHVLSKYGIDKPDLRSTLIIQDLSKYAKATENSDFPIFEVLILKQAKSFPKLIKDPKEYKNRTPIIFKIKNEKDLQSWTSYFKKIAQFNTENTVEINKFLNLEIGDIIAGSTRSKLSYENPTPLGRFRQLSIQEFPNDYKLKDTPFVAAWIENFPLFNPIELSTTEKSDYPVYNFSKFESTHHPFTMCNAETYSKLETAPLETIGDHYDLVLNGLEIGGGSRRIHDPELQRYIFTEILKIPNPERLFQHLLEAFKNGTPPHAGFALGFDRLCAILVGSESIRDVIAFPKTMAGSDMVVGSPSNVKDEVLKEYYVERLKKD